MIKVVKCTACNGTGKESAPPGLHKKCHYCRGTGWVEQRELIRYGK
jgi:DnaJ-class molecular chaperone